MEGVFGLDSELDLMKKLEWEFDSLSKDHANPFVAYNFFVTSWHLLEWKFPDPEGNFIRKRIKENSPLLQVCEHLAIGAKHFSPTKKSLRAVESSGKSGFWSENFWARGFWADGVWASWLEVTLDGPAREEFGEKIKVADLANKVMEFWRGFSVEHHT